MEQLGKDLGLSLLPEMVFGGNFLRVQHEESGFELNFNVYDALSLVSKEVDQNIKVSAASAWSKSRTHHPRDALEVSYDWTFNTPYKGTLLPELLSTIDSPNNNNNKNNNNNNNSDVETKKLPEGEVGEKLQSLSITDEAKTSETSSEEKSPRKEKDTPVASGSEKKDTPGKIPPLFSKPIVIGSSTPIPIARLKAPDPILFNEDVLLFEDELADNGTSILSVRCRVMPEIIFILLRFWLRIDEVLIRVIDTRVYYEIGSDHMIREHTIKESPYSAIKAKFLHDLSSLTDPNVVIPHLPQGSSTLEKIMFPKPF
eukprot:TRINITY_DN7891_c0_g2_i1.p1 TRINITY_DN7891_c0_g2~~TRINITY_DN7891_c0_g2_i1.p1  ORF type:complete len:367 (+),score=89.80 TRINITY_DN7891_c0_g2_i1:162-1103(+)